MARRRFVRRLISSWLAGSLIWAIPAVYAAGQRPAGPRIEFVKKELDFGKIKAGDVVKGEFLFKNTGDAVLHIISVSPSCGCTTADDWPKELAPGSEGRIAVEFNSAGFLGRVTKGVSVVSDAVNEPVSYLRLVCEVWQPVAVSPSYAYLTMLEGQTNMPKGTIHIRSNLDKPIRLLGFEGVPQEIRTTAIELKKGKEFEVDVELASVLPAGAHSFSFNALTDAEEQPKVPLRVYVSVLKRIAVVPERILLPSGRLSSEVVRYASVRLNDDRMRIRKFKAYVEGLQGVSVTSQTLVEGRVFRVQMTFPEGLELGPAQHAKLIIETDVPGAEKFELPIIQSLGPSASGLPAPAAAVQASQSKRD